MKTNVAYSITNREKALVSGGFAFLLLACLAGAALVYRTTTQKMNATPAMATRVIPKITTSSTESPLNITAPFLVQITALVKKDGKRVPGWTGSGAIVSADGLVLTSAQVAHPGKPFLVEDLMISVQNSAGQSWEPAYYADLAQVSNTLDVTVLRIARDLQNQPVDKSKLKLAFASLGDSDLIQNGDPVTIFGISERGSLSKQTNQVAGFQQEPGVSLRAFIQLETSVAGSLSGGAVMDSGGGLVGIATGKDVASIDSQPACLQALDTNRDGQVNAQDHCTPGSQPVTAARPVRLVKSLLTAAQRGETHIEMDRATLVTLPEAGRILFADPFQDASNRWPINNSSSIQDGKFKMVVPAVLSVFPSGIALPFEDVRIDVNISVNTSTGDGDYGAMCRYSDANNYYALEISEDGYYSFWKKQAGKFAPITEWTETDALTPGSASGNFTFTCIGSTLAIIQNGKLIGQATDASLSTGGIGLMAGTWEKGGLAVTFSGLTVRSAGTQPEKPLEILFQDDFTETHTEWWDLTHGGVFFNSGMRIQVNIRQKDLFVRSYQEFNNVRMEVDATPIGGPDDNDYGLLCRYQEATHEFYYFEITSDGKYQIGYYAANGGQVALSNAQFKPSSTILPGKALNHIRADCDGKDLILFVNGTQAALVENDRLSDGGVGMIAGTWDTPGTDVLFDNFFVYNP